MQDWAGQNAALVYLDHATAAFRDHTFKTAITDWAGAWRNWMRREQKFLEERKTDSTRPRAQSFAERDELARRKRWEEMTGRKWPGADGEVVDVASVNSEIQELLQ